MLALSEYVPPSIPIVPPIRLSYVSMSILIIHLGIQYHSSIPPHYSKSVCIAMYIISIIQPMLYSPSNIMLVPSPTTPCVVGLSYESTFHLIPPLIVSTASAPSASPTYITSTSPPP